MGGTTSLLIDGVGTLAERLNGWFGEASRTDCRGLARRTRIRWSMLEETGGDRRGDGSGSFSDDRDSDDDSGRGGGAVGGGDGENREWGVVALGGGFGLDALRGGFSLSALEEGGACVARGRVERRSGAGRRRRVRAGRDGRKFGTRRSRGIRGEA